MVMNILVISSFLLTHRRPNYKSDCNKIKIMYLVQKKSIVDTTLLVAIRFCDTLRILYKNDSS